MALCHDDSTINIIVVIIIIVVVVAVRASTTTIGFTSDIQHQPTRVGLADNVQLVTCLL